MIRLGWVRVVSLKGTISGSSQGLAGSNRAAPNDDLARAMAICLYLTAMAQSKGRNYASMDGPHVHTLSCSETSKLCWYELELCTHPQLLCNAEIMTVYIGLCTEPGRLRNAETMISSAPEKLRPYELWAVGECCTLLTSHTVHAQCQSHLEQNLKPQDFTLKSHVDLPFMANPSYSLFRIGILGSEQGCLAIIYECNFRGPEISNFLILEIDISISGTRKYGRPFLAAAQASDADSLKQVTGMLSELAHVFETTSNDLNSFLAMCNVCDAEQAAFRMSPDECMDDPEDDRNTQESDVPGFALSEGVEMGVEGWDGEEGTGGGVDTTGGSGGAGTSSSAHASDDVKMWDVEGSGDAGPLRPPVVSSTVPPARPFSTSTSPVAPPASSSSSPRRPSIFPGTLKILTGTHSLFFGLPGTVLGAGGSSLAGALGKRALIAPPHIHPSLPLRPPTPMPSRTPPTPSAVVLSTDCKPKTPEALLPQGGGSEGAGEGLWAHELQARVAGRVFFVFVFRSALAPEPPQ
ncbi:hypothetical protein B0H17DRAFT_1124684 [Mycena rosella]|uniref:Uncharacterized protein n=1 Tax=Mycena rosella TaxID=1033263 RepID=A0AAD7MBG3_MYCRO|nr:hypothetical protein B0H17DRAFT_1124684 [Mycena rosella]